MSQLLETNPNNGPEAIATLTANAQGETMNEALTVRESDALMPVMSIETATERYKTIVEYVKNLMHEGSDFGKIPGTDKATLLKPGAEKLCTLFGLSKRFELVEHIEDWRGDQMGEPFFNYLYRARLFRGELLVAEADGSCNSRETKYRWRQGERKCPECGSAAIIKGKEEYGGGFLCFGKKGGCGAKYGDTDERITGQQIGRVPNPDVADQVNCVTPNTRILTRDLRWVPAGEIADGTDLITVAEENQDAYGRPLEIAKAIVYGRTVDSIYRITLGDGRAVDCNGEHRWLVKRTPSNGVEWVSTTEMFEEINVRATGRHRNWKIMSLTRPWDTEETREAGYLAGLLDADGCLGVNAQKGYHGIRVNFAQQLTNGVLSAMTSGLEARGFAYGVVSHGNQRMKEPVAQLAVKGGLPEQMRLLGTIRPPRLLSGWLTKVDVGRRRFEGTPVSVITIQNLGPGEIVRLGTTSQTYIAEGLIAHNTIQKMAQKRALIAATLLAVNASEFFTQDLDDFIDVTPNATPNGTEPKQESNQPEKKTAKRKPQTPKDLLVQSVADAFKLLNHEGDEPKWTPKTANEFVAQRFEGIADVDQLDTDQLNDLLKQLSDRLDALKASRGTIIASIKSNFDTEKHLENYMKDFGGKRLEECTLAELKKIEADVALPF